MAAPDRHPNAGEPWTLEESGTLRDLAGADAHPRLIASRLGRRLAAVRAQAERLGVRLGCSVAARKLEREAARRRTASGGGRRLAPFVPAPGLRPARGAHPRAAAGSAGGPGGGGQPGGGQRLRLSPLRPVLARHTPFAGERRVVQVAWLRDAEELERKRRRGKLAWWLKGLRRW